jgi:predicted ferric reductase
LPVIGTIAIFFGMLLPCALILLDAGRANAQSVLALCAGASAYCLMAINLFLATRPPVVHSLAGGLDRLYQLHKWTGIAVLPLIFFHKFVGMDLDGQIVATGLAKTSVDIAKYAFWILLALLLLSWLKRVPKLRRDLLPYHLWRYSHRLLGGVFIALTLHHIFVKVPFNANALTAKYLLVMAALGIASFAYSQLLAPLRRRRYRVDHVGRHKAATVINVTPLGRRIRQARPGAFGIVRFNRAGLREPHPFTLSQIGADGTLQLSIRPLGDFTQALAKTVAVGDVMSLEAPYGAFDFRKGEDTQIWLAGGIGITPFLSFADSLTAEDSRQIVLIYCVRDPDEALGLERLKAAAARCSGFRVAVHASTTDGRMNAEKLLQIAKMPMQKTGLWFCGPAQMRDAMVRDLKHAGQRPASLHYEEFEFR